MEPIDEATAASDDFTQEEQRNRADPNNWFRIPEIGVDPVDVNFEGFAVPVVFRGCDRLGHRVAVRLLLGMLRDLAQKDRVSLRKLGTALQTAIRKPGQQESDDVLSHQSAIR